MKKVANWKGPGPDSVHGYRLKSFTTPHGRVVLQLNEVLESDSVPQWMNKRRTILCPKDPTIGNAVENFLPITCLPLMWKLFSGVLSEKIYDHLEAEQLFPGEQKGRRKGSRGTKEHLFVDKMVMRNCKRRKTNLAMAWIDYKNRLWHGATLVDFRDPTTHRSSSEHPATCGGKHEDSDIKWAEPRKC